MPKCGMKKTAYKICIYDNSKTCLKQPLKEVKKKLFKTNKCVMQVKIIAECSCGTN